MTWTTPRTWVTNELVTATLMNTHVRDNLNYLLVSRPQNVVPDFDQNSTTSTSWVDMDATNLAAIITPSGTRALVILSVLVTCDNTASNVAYVRIAGDNGAGYSTTGYVQQNKTLTLTLVHVFTGLTPGTTYTFTGQFRAATGTIYSYNFSGTGALGHILALEV